MKASPALVRQGRRHSLSSEPGALRTFNQLHVQKARRSSLHSVASETSESSLESSDLVANQADFVNQDISNKGDFSNQGEIRNMFVRNFAVNQEEGDTKASLISQQENKVSRKKGKNYAISRLAMDLVLDEPVTNGDKTRKRRSYSNSNQEQKSPNRTGAVHEISRSRTPCRSEHRQEQNRRSRTPRTADKPKEEPARRSHRTPKSDEPEPEPIKPVKPGRRNLFDDLDSSACESTDVEETIENMPYLTAEQSHREKGYTPDQTKCLKQVFELTWHPSATQKSVLAEKLGIPLENIRYWFDNNRRKFIKLVSRGEQLDSIAWRREQNGGMSPRVENEGSIHRFRSPRKEKLNAEEKIPRSSKIINYVRKKIKTSEDSLDEVIESGKVLCIGVALDKDTAACLLCPLEFDNIEDLTSHLADHKFKAKFCNAYREQGDLELRYKGCRKVFSVETFNDHHCSSEPPVRFQTMPGIPSRRSSAAESVASVTSEGGRLELKARIDELTSQGRSVCIGFELDIVAYCNMCRTSCSNRWNLYRHFQRHEVSFKFCSTSDRSKEPDRVGCSKMFTKETFHLHKCETGMPEPLGYFPLTGPGSLASEGRRPLPSGDDMSSAEDTEEEDEDDSDEDDEEQEGTAVDLAAHMLSQGLEVCLAYEISDTCTQCTFCPYYCTVRGNMYKHNAIHGFSNIKFCSKPDRQAIHKIIKKN